MDTSLIKLTEKNKKQKEENKEYIMNLIKEQIKEIDKLKEENKDLKLRAPMPLEYYEDAIGNLEEENKELKEELCRYKITADEFADVFVRVGELVENTNLPRYGEHLVSEFKKLKEENEELQEYIDKLEEQEELKSIGKDDKNGNYQDIIEDLEQANKELQEENKELNANFKEEREEKKKLKEENKTSNDVNIKLKDDNVKLIDEIECMKSHSDMSEEEYEGELKDKEAIVNYLTEELDKYKKLFNKSKKENEKVKDIKGIVVNEDKTIITINGIQLKIGDKFISDITEYTLREIYVGKTGKYSLRTDKITIRLGANFITGKFKIVKKE